MRRPITLILLVLAVAAGSLAASSLAADELPQNDSIRRFELADVFQLEFASDPQISPNGKQVVYVRNSMDVMTDKLRSRLWLIDNSGENHRPLTDFKANASLPRWSPDGKRLAFVASDEDRAQIFVRWMDSGQTARLTNVSEGPRELCWSPDGRQLAFAMLVPEKSEPYVKLPDKPEGAEWAKPFKVIDTLVYRSDGRGYLKGGYSHLFVLPADGGTPRQLTSGSFHHGQPQWTADNSLIFSANRRDEWDYEPLNDDLYEVTLADGKIKQLTDRQGPDQSPAVSPDGKRIAFVGFDDKGRSYHQSELYVMNRNGRRRKCLTEKLDRSVHSPQFSRDGRGVYFMFDDEGTTKLGYVTIKTQELVTVTKDIGGTTLGRPYASGSYTVAKGGRIAFTATSPYRPAEVACISKGAVPQQLPGTQLNEDLFAHKQLARVESFHYDSSHDQRKIHAWIVKPPDFDPQKKYPLILEIHGGPFANYGDRFSAEIQLYAAAGYVVLYVNPRGSTGYGYEFAALIDHNYPSEDYDDLMSGVDAVIERGYVDPRRLYVTGGSGGGVLSSWIVGKTNRFQAAVVAKPVINWYSFVLTADHYNYFARYWFGKYPWEDPEAYLKRSSISLVGNVTTPTMLLTGENDYRTPISESEQFYQALKLRKVDTMLVRVPDASHGIAARPSHLIAKVAHVLKWFETHPPKEDP